MGMLFGGWANDPYELDRQDRIAQIGQVAYDKEVEEYQRKYKEEHPEQYRWSTTEPKVTYRDVIAHWNAEKQVAENEAVIQGIAENGDIMVSYMDNRQDSGTVKWEGEYSKVCSVASEDWDNGTGKRKIYDNTENKK